MKSQNTWLAETLEKTYSNFKIKIFKKKPGSIKLSKDPNIKDLEKSIIDKTGLNVSIKNNKRNKGTITFSYHDGEQLNKIIDIVKSNY